MSCSYAEGLSEYHDKGKLGLPEKFDVNSDIIGKVTTLTEWVRNAQHIVVHTGAGISTSAGIPDFRGPKGVWTLEKKGKKPDMNVSWDDARPTKTHMALAKLIEVGKVKFLISQNIDGLHLRSGVPREKIAELHGNMFLEQCDKCKKMFVRDSPAPTVGQKYVGGDCMATRSNGRNCRGKLKDFVLDWEGELPDSDLSLSDSHSVLADLSIVMGSTLQIIPAGNMPTYTKKYDQKGKLVICNLQPTKHDKKADLNIHTYVDDVMEMLMKNLGLEIPQYNKDDDPVKRVARGEYSHDDLYIDWTQDEEHAKDVKRLSDRIHDEYLRRRREEKKRKSDAGEVVKKQKMMKREEEEEEIKEERDEIQNINGDSLKVENGSLKDSRNKRSCKKRDSYKFQDDDEDVEAHDEEEKDEDIEAHDEEDNDEEENVKHEIEEPTETVNGDFSGGKTDVTAETESGR